MIGGWSFVPGKPVVRGYDTNPSGQREVGTRKPRLDSVLLYMVAKIFVRAYEIRYHLGNARNSLDQRDDICF